MKEIDKHQEKHREFLTARQLAEILQIGESTVHRLRRHGRIPAIMVTKRLIRFNLRDVRAALANNPRKGHSDDKDSGQLSFDDVFAGFCEE
jgi:excisionase family DNA binding protein